MPAPNPYPENTDFFDGDLAEKLFQLQEENRRLREQAERYERLDTACAALELSLARASERGGLVVILRTVQDLLGAAACFGACGVRHGALDDLLEAYEAWRQT